MCFSDNVSCIVIIQLPLKYIIKCVFSDFLKPMEVNFLNIPRILLIVPKTNTEHVRPFVMQGVLKSRPEYTKDWTSASERISSDSKVTESGVALDSAVPSVQF